jgi:hypothetical protein
MTVPLDKSILIVDEHPDASKVRYAAQAYGYKITSKPKDPNLHTVLVSFEAFFCYIVVPERRILS